jgi:hypothetical protein
MVGAAADPTAQSPWLHESEVVGVARLPPTEEAWLRRHELQMGAIAIAARLAQRQGTLVFQGTALFTGGNSGRDGAAG